MRVINIRNVKNPFFSVIVPTLNEEGYIEETLKRIKNQDFKDYELIVSDGNSRDKTVEIAKKYADRIVIDKKRGIHVQQNNGAYVAKGKYLVFVQADSLVSSGFLKKIQFFINKKNADAGGCFIFFGREGKSILYTVYSYFMMVLNLIVGNFGFFAIGTTFFIRKDLFKSMGGFRGVVCEDLDLFARLRNHKGRSIYIPTIKVITSQRRFRKWGFLRTTLLWLRLGISFYFFGSSKSIDYDIVR